MILRAPLTHPPTAVGTSLVDPSLPLCGKEGGKNVILDLLLTCLLIQLVRGLFFVWR